MCNSRVFNHLPRDTGPTRHDRGGLDRSRWVFIRARVAVVSGLLALWSIAGAVPQGEHRNLLWPLDSPPRLRSSFGEYRPGGRVHGGVDLSTGGATGLPVRAAGDGEIFQLKIQWRGYGRALYLRLTDGRILVYAHLESFSAPGLNAAVEAARARRGRYPGNLTISPPVQVRRGQIIARTGESGSGLPHLHFEIRTPGNLPSDPLADGVLPPVQDTEPPRIEALWVFSGKTGAWVGGAGTERRLEVRRGVAGTLEAGPLQVAGLFDLAVEAHDLAPGGSKLGVSAIRVWWDGREVASSHVGPYSFGEIRKVSAIHDARYSHLSPTRFAYRPLAYHGPSAWSDSSPPGLLESTPGSEHRLQVEVRDAVGNASRIGLTVLGVSEATLAREQVSVGALSMAEQPCVDLTSARWLSGSVALPVVHPGDGSCPQETRRYHLLRSDGFPASASHWRSRGAAGATAGALLLAQIPEGGRLRFYADLQAVYEATQVIVGTGSTVTRSGSANLHMPRGALPPDTALTLHEVPSQRAEEGLIPAGTAVRIEPAWRIPAVQALLGFSFDPHRYRMERVGIYQWNPVRKRWSHVGGTGEAEQGEVEIRLGEFGLFRPFEDTAPPEWGRIQPTSNSSIGPGMRRVRVVVTDHGSGIDWEGITLELDGKVLLFEYDPDHDRAEALLDGTMAVGKHHLRARAIDRAGNRSADLEWSFRWVRDP